MVVLQELKRELRCSAPMKPWYRFEDAARHRAPGLNRHRWSFDQLHPGDAGAMRRRYYDPCHSERSEESAVLVRATSLYRDARSLA
jgi:hypothetical protein